MMWWYALSAKGVKLMTDLASETDRLFAPSRLAQGKIEPVPSAAQWGKQAMGQARAIVVVGSCGLACRLLCPHMKGKAVDPAVVVLDETARWSIALLSGHLGGAVELARHLAALSGAQPVITTATDNRGLVAIDTLARQQGWVVENPKNIVHLSSAMLEGRILAWRCDGQVAVPCGFSEDGDRSLGALLSPFVQADPFEVTLRLRPKVLTLGVGCRKACDSEHLQIMFHQFMDQHKVSPLSIRSVNSIELKKDEVAIHQLATKFNTQLYFWSADQLNRLEGEFSFSSRVKQVTGVDCVCERAALVQNQMLQVKKWSNQGVTFALGIEREWKR